MAYFDAGYVEADQPGCNRMTELVKIYAWIQEQKGKANINPPGAERIRIGVSYLPANPAPANSTNTTTGTRTFCCEI